MNAGWWGSKEPEDVEEDSTWTCECGASGTCRKGDEAAAAAVHKASHK